MAWNLPSLPSVGSIATVANWATKVRDSLRYLKGMDGVPTIESGLTIDNSDGDERLLLPLLSTAECTTVLNAEGEVAFDEQTHRGKYYNGSAIGSIVTTIDVDDTAGGTDAATTDPISSNVHYDHCQAADPHVGYVLKSLADAAGDVFYASGDNTWARLAKGTALQVLRMNSGVTAPEWVTFSSGVGLESTVADFQTNAATGTFSITLENVNDNNTATIGAGQNVGEYTEINYGKVVWIKQWRMFGHASNSADGAAKIQYYDLVGHAWEDWVTGIVDRVASWTNLAEGTPVLTDKVRFVVTTLPTSNYYRVGELEIYY